MLDKAKLSLLRVAKARLALSEDDYRAILANVGGVHSARDLGDGEFDAVMDRFRALGFTSTARQRTFGERAGMASPAQVATIRELWSQWATEPTDSNLNHFLERTFKVSALRFLDAPKAVKAMVAKKVAAGGA